jgi:CYTH domain-containing protein
MSRQDEDGGLGPSARLREGKYAQVERERRFLLNEPPSLTAATTTRQITDRYLTGTRLRLRLIHREDTNAEEYKLTQKVPSLGRGAIQGLITTTYLNRVEYDLLASLPAVVLTKTRISLAPMGIDVFRGPLEGLVMAEAEFGSDADCHSFVPPSYCVAEVTADARFTGGRLAHTDRHEMLVWLAEFGIEPSGPR